MNLIKKLGNSSKSRWKYYIPHEWDQPKAIWEEIYLVPDIPNFPKLSICVNIDALGEIKDPYGTDRNEVYQEFKEQLNGAKYYIDGEQMVVKARNFTRKDLVKWVKIWLEQTGFEVSELVEAPSEDFEGIEDTDDYMVMRTMIEEM